MTWEAAATVAETIAALGVIASLVYLASQVHNENRAAAVAAKLASTKLLSDFVDAMIANPALMDLWLRGRKGETLDEMERHRFANMCLKAFWFYSAAHFQLRMKTLTDDDWAEFYAVIRFWLDGPGVQTWWANTGRARFGGAFVTFIDGEIAQVTSAQATTTS